MADSAETRLDLRGETGSLTQIDLAQPETDPYETASLKDIAERCQRHLQRHLHKLWQGEGAQEDIVKAKDGHWISRQYAEFNLWCTKVGVHGEGLRSIDVRLKDVPEICSLLGRLLQSLERDLKELEQSAEPCESIITADDDDNDDYENDDESDASSLSFESLSSAGHSQAGSAPETPELSLRKRDLALQAHIEDTIDRLHGHALQIENAGANHRRRRVELYRQKEGPRGAYDGFKALALHKARLQFKKASEPFLERLAESFARRRIRLEYLKEHQTKRTVDNPKPERNAAPKSAAELGVQEFEEQKTPESKRIVIVPIRSHDQHTIYSGTVETKLDLRSQLRRPEKAESVASVALRNPGFPPPPRCFDSGFQCPYCRLEFRSREAEKDRWSQHVMRDFEPYFCIWEDCNAPFDVPNTFEGLLSHLQSHVAVQYHVDMPDGEHMTFDEEGFEAHVAQHDNAAKEMLATMKEASRHRAAFMFESCPFCGGFPDDVEKRFPDRDSLECQSELRKHVKQHMQDVALFLPPFRDDIFDEDEDLKSSVASHRRSAGRNFVEDPSEFVDSCLREDCECKRSGLYDELLADIPNEPPTVTLWAEYFPHLPRYDLTPVQDDYYRDEESLQPFVVRAQDRENNIKLRRRYMEPTTAAWQPLYSTPANHPDRAALLSNLGTKLYGQYERTGTVGDLDEAITAAREALNSTPADHPNRIDRLNNLNTMLRGSDTRTRAMAEITTTHDQLQASSHVDETVPERRPITPPSATSGNTCSLTGTMRPMEGEPYTVKCICNFSHDDGSIIYCKTCDTWQHIDCFYPDNRDEAIHVDFCHSCAECKPRPLDRHRAIERTLRLGKGTTVQQFPGSRPPSNRHPISPLHFAPPSTASLPDLPDDFIIHHYSAGFHSLYNDSDVSVTHKNAFANLGVPTALSRWLRDPEAMKEEIGCTHDEVFQTDPPLSNEKTPTLEFVHSTWTTSEGMTLRWRSIKSLSPISKDIRLIELNGQIGFQKDYCSDPENLWMDLSSPLPFVFFHPILPLYIDCRKKGSRARYIRRSCKPNAYLDTYLSSDSECHFWLVSYRSILASEQLTLPWDFRLEKGVSSRWFNFLGLVDDDAATLDEPEMEESEYVAISNWIDRVLSEYGGCACGLENECAFALFHRNYLSRKKHAP